MQKELGRGGSSQNVKNINHHKGHKYRTTKLPQIAKLEEMVVNLREHIEQILEV